MVRCDPFGRTEGMRRQVNDLILTAYSKGYNDGEHDEQDRKLEMLLKEKKGRWIPNNVVNAVCPWCCSECNSNQTNRTPYCQMCGARMEESDGQDI